MSKTTVMKQWPQISIITPSFNQADFLDQTIRSVLDQGYANLEYIVIDGGSSDRSPQVIQRYADRLAYWQSEPDRGQPHAINKGLARATGDIVGYLNSDDLYLPGALHAVADAFMRDPQTQWIAGGVLMFGEPEAMHDPAWWRGAWVPTDAAACIHKNYEAPQPGMFWRRERFDKHGGFDESMRYCFDHEFYARIMVAGCTCRPLQRPVAAYRFHGSSKTVAEGDKFRAEFKLVRERYIDQVPAARAKAEARLAARRDQRTGILGAFNKAIRLAGDGERGLAWREWRLAVRHAPRMALSRASLGCLRRIMTAPGRGRQPRAMPERGPHGGTTQA